MPKHLRKYNSARGGHAPGHLRHALYAALEEGGLDSWRRKLKIAFYNPKQQQAWQQMSAAERGSWLIGQLWNCTDQVGQIDASLFDSRPTTVARLVRLLAVES